MKEIATKSSWKNHPIDNPKRIDIELQFTAEQFSKLTYGLIPEEMEDKWFIFLQNDWLYFHRSWTGFGFCNAPHSLGLPASHSPHRFVPKFIFTPDTTCRNLIIPLPKIQNHDPDTQTTKHIQTSSLSRSQSLSRPIASFARLSVTQSLPLSVNFC